MCSVYYVRICEAGNEKELRHRIIENVRYRYIGDTYSKVVFKSFPLRRKALHSFQQRYVALLDFRRIVSNFSLLNKFICRKSLVIKKKLVIQFQQVCSTSRTFMSFQHSQKTATKLLNDHNYTIAVFQVFHQHFGDRTRVAREITKKSKNTPASFHFHCRNYKCNNSRQSAIVRYKDILESVIGIHKKILCPVNSYGSKVYEVQCINLNGLLTVIGLPRAALRGLPRRIFTLKRETDKIG